MNNSDPIYDKNPMEEESSGGQVMIPQAVAAAPAQTRQYDAPMASQESGERERLRWLREEEIDDLQARWNSIQTRFVDEPRSSVEQADALIEDTMARIAKAFTNKRTLLDQQWMNQADISTEDLRTTLQGYRSFLNRLLEL